jgi:hypothetical protein
LGDLAEQPGPDISFHSIEPHIHVFRENPGMGEDGFPQDHLYRLLTEKLGQGAAGAGSDSPSPLYGLQLDQDGIGRIDLHFTPEICEAPFRHIPEIQVGVHQLMVSVQDMYGSSGLCRLGLEPLKQVDDLGLTVTPVQNVPGLNHNQVSPDPPIFGVDGTGQT